MCVIGTVVNVPRLQRFLLFIIVALLLFLFLVAVAFLVIIAISTLCVWVHKCESQRCKKYFPDIVAAICEHMCIHTHLDHLEQCDI